MRSRRGSQATVGEDSLSVGESEVGKTSMLRAIAGLWRSCRSRIAATQFEFKLGLNCSRARQRRGGRDLS